MGTRALWRFDEYAASQRPTDAIGAVADMTQIPPYWQSGAQISALIGGVWKGGWSADQGGTSIVPIFGGVTFAPVSGALTYASGALGGSDKAFAFNTAATGLDGGANYDVGLNDDLGIMWVGKWTALPPAYGTILSKVSGGFGNGWALTGTDGGAVVLGVGAGAGGVGATSISEYYLGDWHLGLAGLDRATARIRIVAVNLRTLAATLGALNATAAVSASVANNVTLGNSAWVPANYSTFYMSQFYIAHGAGAFAGLANDIQARALLAANALLSAPAVVDAAAGRGRSFVALSRHGFEGADVVAGSTLLTRDATVQALVRFDIQDQGGAGTWTVAKTNGAAAWDAGASSVETIAGDGFVEYEVINDGHNFVIGLSATDPNVNYTSIAYGLNQAYGDLYIQELGVQKAGPLALNNGDILRVNRTGTTITYLRNGGVVYTSATLTSAPLLVDTSFLDVGAGTAGGLHIVSAGIPIPITWQKPTNVTMTQTANVAGTLYSHGKATAVADYQSAGVELRVANASQNVAELRWLWQTGAGALKRQAGGYFTAPVDGSSILLTATRRWVSPTSVILRHYLGDRLLSEVETADGDIGGGTTGTTTIGARYDGTAWLDFFDGVIDGLRVVDYEMSREEIEATWKRISKYQPDGYRRMNDLMQPGLPISDDPSSRVQSDIRTMGTALGYGDAQIENVRENLMPDRAYGRVLERWEGITQRGAKPSDSVDKRRARVTGHIGKRDGVSPPGVANATAEVLATTPANIPIIAFSNTIRDPFIAVEGERWQSGLGPTPIGLGTTTVAGTRVTKNAGVNGVWDAGCSASTRIIGDGRIDTYQQAPNANEKRLIGFTDLAAPTHSSDIKWALYFGRTASSDVEVFENSIGPFAATSFALDDLFTIRRRGDTIEYMKNETVFYTSLVKSTAALALDLSLFNTTPSYFPDIRMMKDASSEVEIIFDSKANVGITYELISPYGARVERTAGGGIWNGKTRSNESIAGDGYVEVFVNSVAIAYRSFAFTLATDVLGADLSENTTDYCIGYCDVGPIWRAVERGVIVFSQAVAVGDILRIERIGSVVVYKKNGAIQYTSTVQTVAALVVDTQFFGAAAIDALRLYDAGVRVPLTFATVSGAVSSASGDSLRMNGPGLNVQWDPSNANGMRCVMPVEAPRPQSTFYNQLHAFCALDLVTANTQIESGIVLWNPEFSPQCMCFFGVRYNAGTVQVGYEYFRTGDGFGFDQAWTVLATTSQTKHWLRVRPRDGAFGGGSQDHPYQLSWSTTGNQEANFSHSTVIQYRRYVGWWGLYTRSINGTSPVFDIRFSEVAFRNGLGSRPFYWYALRDPALPGVPDVQGARPIATQLAQAFTVGHVCSRKSFLLDDPLCTCDGGPMGGL